MLLICKNMFDGCSSLTFLDLKSFDTSKVSLMNHMFNDCNSLKSLNLEFFNTSKVINMEYMFNGCSSLTSLNLNSFDTSKVNNMTYMFNGCISLISLNLNNFDTSNVNNMSYMFNDCNSLETLNINNFNTLNVINMQNMFNGCFSLTFLDLNNFITSNVTNFSYMFDSCISLTSLNINNFDTQNVIYMENMFNDCNSLKILNLSSFDTSKVSTMKKLFNGCSSLISLNLSNFKTSTVKDFSKMFYSCSNLEYINIYSFSFSKVTSAEKIFTGTPDNIVYCINNDNSNSEYLKTLTNKKCPINYCLDNWKDKQKKIIDEIRECIDECFKNENYSYLYGNKCYSKCPEGTHQSSDNQHICEKDNIICPENFPYILEESNECIKECQISDFFKNKCKINNLNINIQKNIINNIINQIQEKPMDSFLLNILNNNKNDELKNEKNLFYQITSSDNQNNNEYSNISSIKLGECENILKNNYKIDKNESLLIFKYDLFLPELSIPIIGYDVFHPKTKEKLDLNYCKNNKIYYSIPVTINEDTLFIYNKSDDYYTDRCKKASTKNGVDITLFDRKNEFNNNYLSLCLKGCEYKGYNYTNKKVLCECEPKTNSLMLSQSIINKDKLLNNFIDIESMSNIGLIKCSKILFSKEGLINNSGSYILILIIFIFIISIIFFYLKGKLFLLNEIKEIMRVKIENKNKIDINSNINESINQDKSKIREKTNLIKENELINTNNLINSSSILNLKNNSKKKDIFRNNDKQNNHKIKNEKRSDDEKKIEKGDNYIDSELNSFSYDEAKVNDKRTYFQYYISLVKTKHLLVFTFFLNNDYNSMIIKICLFLFSFSLFYVVNALFFNDKTMHKIYEDEGTFNFIYSIPQIIYSSLISSIINIIVKKLSLTNNYFTELKREKDINEAEKKVIKIKKVMKIKFIIFFILSFVFLILFWYYISCFCAVYKNTQMYLIKDTLISFSFSLIYPFFIYLIPGIFRIPSLNNPEIFYKLSKFVQLL